MVPSADYLKSLIDLESGKISPEIFIDEDIYRLELEKVFGRSWLLIMANRISANFSIIALMPTLMAQVY